VDANGDGKVQFDEFVKLMQDSKGKGGDPKKELEEAFKVFDADGNGQIDAAELKEAMTTLGEPLTNEELNAMMKAADKDGNGTIDYKEFVALFLS